MNEQLNPNRDMAGFSLFELLIAMTVTLAILAIGSTVLSSGVKIRAREQSVSDATADVQRAINIMSREIANAGFRLRTNGIVPEDSGSSQIRVRSNLNKYDSDVTLSAASRNGVIDAGEDVKYLVNAADQTNYLVRYDINGPVDRNKTVLANRLDSLRIHYFAQKVTYSTGDCDISAPSSGEVAPNLAGYVVIAVCVRLQPVGRQGTPGYQAERNVLLVSDVTLRNADMSSY